MAERWKQRVIAEVARRGLVSVMNDTKWNELRAAVRKLPFPPPYQFKGVLSPDPEPQNFDADVGYWGDWSDESLAPFYSIEWIRVRPRYLRHRGRLISPAVESVEAEFLSILPRFQIPHRSDTDSVWIYGYTSEASSLMKARSD